MADSFATVLTTYLHAQHPDLLAGMTTPEREDFLQSRAARAAGAYEHLRRAGANVTTAIEGAHAALTEGLDSSYAYLLRLLEEQFPREYDALVNAETLPDVLLGLCRAFRLQWEEITAATGRERELRENALIGNLQDRLAADGLLRQDAPAGQPQRPGTGV